MRLEVIPYSATLESAWNTLVAESRNGTFLFDRRFMDYHAHRFTDASLCVMEDGRMLAALPASQDGTAIVSHGGLTYGGLIVGERHTGAADIFRMLTMIAERLAAFGAKRFVYKPVPHIYHRAPSEDDLSALFRLGAKLTRRDLSSAIAPHAPVPLRKGRKALVQRASGKPGLSFAESTDFAGFHALLTQRLAERRGLSPVHTVDEIKLLTSRFSSKIRLHAAHLEGRMIAACLTFETSRVIHTQYIASDAEGRDSGAIDHIVARLIARAQSEGRWFDFGISTLENGRVLDEGLIAYKEGFGARGIAYDRYEVTL
ncbi:GNAT family N-acetyltransferase [Aestuariivirga sp.]|uniref:GNAT family N-acetyltransferase n=1 Tax=Aestuariivirga sp. TaxID=2650926 RepID=UPI0039E28FD1